MENININEKVRELADNKEFMDRIHETKSIEEYQQLLAEYGVETTVEELKSGIEQMSAKLSENGELTADDLDMVAGGLSVKGRTYVYMAGQIGCTLVMMACATNPVGWFAAACVCGGAALLSLRK